MKSPWLNECYPSRDMKDNRRKNKMIWIIRDNNSDATKYYLNILEKAATLANQNVVQVVNASKSKKGKTNDVYLVTTLLDVIRVYLMGKRRIIMWFQGAFVEESYMKHKNNFRKILLEKVEKYTLKKSMLLFFVSEEMKNHYAEKYSIDIENKYYLMPCFNTNINKDSFFEKDKYSNNIFAYAGSLSIWQGFDKIIACYEMIEKIGIPNTKLLILTSEKEKAKEIIGQTDIRHYEVRYVPMEKLPIVLSEVKFGFIIRDDVIVNRVATPTKISTYLANGLIPIYSECLSDFHKISEGFTYKLSYDSEDFLGNLQRFMLEEIKAVDVYHEYVGLFSTYYNAEYHANRIADLIRCLPL